MGVKENVMMAGGVAAVIGIGKVLTRGTEIPSWLTIAIWIPIIALFGFAAFQIYTIQQRMKEKEAKREKGADDTL